MAAKHRAEDRPSPAYGFHAGNTHPDRRAYGYRDDFDEQEDRYARSLAPVRPRHGTPMAA